jgi:penicillin V acylase-like amidase (Ntn superfamily)
MGTGTMLVFAATILLLVEAAEICVEAAAPVRTRATTAARTMIFMMRIPQKLYLPSKNFYRQNQ